MAVIDYTVVATSLGRSLTDAEQAQVTQWIDDAELIIRLRLGDLDALDQDALAYVVREAVLARLRNPGGVTEESRQIDDFKVTRKLSSSNNIRIWNEWWELLAPTTTSSAFTITPGTRATRAYDAERLDPWISE